MRSRAAALVLLFAAAARADPPPKKGPHTEPAVAPFVGGDSDIGFGGGAFGAVTRADESLRPKYIWRIETGFLATFKASSSSGGSLRVPYQDYYALLSVPHLEGDRLRLEVRPSYTRETTQRYYGIGNASRDTAPEVPDDPSDPYWEYGRSHPTLLIRARVRLHRELFLLLGNSYTRDWLSVRPNSKLAKDGVAGPLEHGVDFFEYGLELDERDDDLVTRHGTWDQLKLRLSPGGTPDMPYRYAQLDAIARQYVPIGARVVLALRGVFDVQMGDPPFYELARYEDTFALGGSMGVRGVPGQRYYGRVKAFGNLETRVHMVDFELFGKPLALGAAAFFDGGRVWTELGHAHPDLDGTGLGLHFGVGAGLRITQGKTFVVRGDVAWSPDAHPIGGYFAAGEAF